ncbi:MAG: hypothetical protein IJ387_05290, partial [Thermoguttaceae bacterium]|nr:hypothetical protein [Thermoguttaceae bacterium]
ASFLFDAFSNAVDAETAEAPETDALEADGESSGSNRKRAKRRLKLLRKLKTVSETERSDNDVNAGKRGGEARKERRRVKSEKSANFARSARPASASRFRFGSKGRVDGESGWATVGRTSSDDGGRRSAARRFWTRVPKPTLFQNLIIALAVVALSTAVGFWAQESALQARFRDDFRIQIAAPRTLARGESQTIAATTTGPNGKPRRVPIRFSFSDAETGAPLLAHTESGDASGVARFKIPDVSGFPARTLLTISAGEREMETFETILSVVDAPKTNDGANAAARFAALETVDESAVEVATSEKRRAQKKAFAEAPKKRNDGRSMAMNASLAPTGEMGTATGSPSAPAPGTTAAPPISGFDAMAMDAPASPDGGMGTATGSPSASPSSDVAMSNKTSATMGASPLFDVATSAQMGGTGAPPSASPSSDGETANKADASPRNNLAAAFLPSLGPMGTSASNDDLDAETPTAVVEEAAPNDFDGAVAELERALSDGGETLESETTARTGASWPRRSTRRRNAGSTFAFIRPEDGSSPGAKTSFGSNASTKPGARSSASSR